MQPQEPEKSGDDADDFHKSDTQETRKIEDTNEAPNFDALDEQAPNAEEVVSDHLNDRIEAEDVVKPTKRPGNKVIAERAGLSPSTVSKALNKPESVSEKTRMLVQKALKELEAELEPAIKVEEAESEIEVKVIIPPEESKESKQDKEIASLIKEVGTYTGRSSEPTIQYMQVGGLIDMWADVIEGYGEKAPDFYKQFDVIFQSRNITMMEKSLDNLQATGMVSPPYRKMIFYKRYPVTVTLYIATQGKDLYVSWRAFAQASIAWWKLAVLAGVSALVGLGVMNTVAGFNRSVVNFQNYMTGNRFGYALPDTGIAFFWGMAFFIAVGGWLCLQAYQKLDGDFLGYFREPLNELHADDVASASAAVHKTIIHTADKLGIDTAKLEIREPFYKTRKKPRF